MFGWLRRTTKRATARVVRARYDAARTTPDNRRHWEAADGLSAAAANNAEVRRTLRNRSRYEVANNSYAGGTVETLADDSVGTGPRLQLLTEDAAANRFIEREFAVWCDASGFGETLHVLRQARTVDGEAFGLLSSNPDLQTPVQLCLSEIEADRIQGEGWDDPADGISFDAYGNPTSYRVLRGHPGDGFGIGGDADLYAADSVIHWMKRKRPGQLRGVPELTPSLPLFAQLRRYTLAVLASAETAADFAAVLQTNSPAGGEADGYEDVPPEMEIEKRLMTTLPAGWQMSQLKAEQPTTTYPGFKAEIIGEIARCLSVPYNVIAGNSSSYNYASGRLDFQTYFKSIRVDQRRIERLVLSRVLRAWLDEAALIPGYLPPNLGPFLSWPMQWFWDGSEHVDPQKEANAQGTRLANHTTTLAHEYARQGRDWEEALRQRAKEMRLMSELGLTPTVAAPTEPPDDEEEEVTEEEEDASAVE